MTVDDLAVEIIRDGAELDGLAGEWARLYARCSAATPFQSHAWVSAWWHAYGVPGRLRLVLARRRGRLVAAVPLVLVRRLGWRVLAPVGREQSDFTDILLDDDRAEETAAAVRDACRREPGWDVIDFPEVRPGSAIEHLRACWDAPRWTLPASVCVQLPGQPIERLLAAHSGRKAGKLRRCLRRAEALDASAVPVPAADAEAGVARLLELHAMQWERREINAEHTSPRFQALLTRAARRLVGEGLAVLSEYRAGGRLVAADLAVVGKDFVGGYLYAAHPSLRAETDIVTLLLRRNLGLAHELERPVLSLLRGAEPHKEKWGGRRVRSQRVILGRGRAAIGYATAARSRLAMRGLAVRRLPIQTLTVSRLAVRRVDVRRVAGEVGAP
jgi:CelD/BcsL family acetyltransferase involved in cellulose biosynthesis